MERLFSQLQVIDVQQPVVRNIVSIRQSQDLFDDLSNSPDDWSAAQHVEDTVKPPPYSSHSPVIDRPFEDAAWFNAVQWPFDHWQSNRYSNGKFGVWYGSAQAETTVYETVYHWYSGFLRDAGFETESVVGERKLYNVTCSAMLLDFRPAFLSEPRLRHGTDYSFSQAVGARLHGEGYPGLLTHSVRHEGGENFVILNSKVLSEPKLLCQVTYRVEGQHIRIEKQVGVEWMSIPTDTF